MSRCGRKANRAAKARVAREGNKPLDLAWFNEQRRKQAKRVSQRRKG